MAIEVQCPCGKNVTVRDELAGKRVKCPVCAEILTVADNGDSADAFLDEHVDARGSDAQPEPPRTPRVSGDASVTGKRANVLSGTLVPVPFGSTTLTLTKGRVVADTRKPLAKRHVQLRLTHVDSAEVSTTRNPVLLVLGLATVPVYGIGLLVLLVWILLKFRYLSIRSSASTLAVRMQGPEDPYFDFMESVLVAAEEHTHDSAHP